MIERKSPKLKLWTPKAGLESKALALEFYPTSKFISKTFEFYKK
jgi:hypothetical protein